MDKWIHFLVAWLIVVTIGLFTYSWIGLIAGVVATLAKDFIWDKWLKKGTFEWADIMSGLTGCLIGFCSTFLYEHI